MVEAATKFAKAFGLTLSEFLDELSERISALRGAATANPPPFRMPREDSAKHRRLRRPVRAHE